MAEERTRFGADHSHGPAYLMLGLAWLPTVSVVALTLVLHLLVLVLVLVPMQALARVLAAVWRPRRPPRFC